MAIKEIVKGMCNITRCKYDVYTKEKTDELLDIKANKSDVYVKDDYVVLTGTTTSNNSGVKLSYPSGFTKDNCVVISGLYKYTHSISGTNIQDGSWYPTGKKVLNELTADYNLSNEGLYIMHTQETSGSLNIVKVDYKLILMKIS